MKNDEICTKSTLFGAYQPPRHRDLCRCVYIILTWVRYNKDMFFAVPRKATLHIELKSLITFRTRGVLRIVPPRVRFLCPFPSKIPNRWYSDMPPVSEIIGTGCSCYYAHGVWNLVCTVCVCSHLPSPPQEEKRHKVKMPCASMLKCQCLTNVVNVWEGEFDMTEIWFL